MLTTFKLKNGIRVAVYSMSNLRSFTMTTISKSGSIVETKEDNGVAHFMEHMLVQGTPSLPTAEAISAYVEGMAGSYNVSTSQFLVSFDIALPASHIEDAVKISSEVFFQPLFPKDAVEKERRAIMEELRQRMDSPSYKIGKFFKETRFAKNSPLRLTVGGALTVMRKMSRQVVISYWERYFTPGNTYILAVGKCDVGRLKKLLEQYFETVPVSRDVKLPKLTREHFTEKKIAFRHDPKLKSNYIHFVFPTLANDDPFELQLGQELLHLVLGKLRQSRLFRYLRYEKGLVYDVSSTSYCVEGIGYSLLSSEVSGKNLEEVVVIMGEILADFVKSGPTEQELEVAREYLSNQWLMSFDNPASIADWLEDELVWQGQVRMPEDLIKNIRTLKSTDLVSLMKKYWDIDKLNLIIQGPEKMSSSRKARFTRLLDSLKN